MYMYYNSVSHFSFPASTLVFITIIDRLNIYHYFWNVKILLEILLIILMHFN